MRYFVTVLIAISMLLAVTVRSEQKRVDFSGKWKLNDEMSDLVAPRTQIEELLADIWAEILGLDQVGAGDNFFALGGHSLLATQVISRLRTAFEVDMPLQSLFEAPTVAEMARLVDDARRGAPGLAAPPLVPVGRDQDADRCDRLVPQIRHCCLVLPDRPRIGRDPDQDPLVDSPVGEIEIDHGGNHGCIGGR